MSPATPLILIAISALLLALIFLIRRFFMTSFIWGGVMTVPAMLVSLVLMVGGDILADELFGSMDIPTAYLDKAIGSMTPVAIGFTIAAVGMIVLGAILSKAQKRKQA